MFEDIIVPNEPHGVKHLDNQEIGLVALSALLGLFLLMYLIRRLRKTGRIHSWIQRRKLDVRGMHLAQYEKTRSNAANSAATRAIPAIHEHISASIPSSPTSPSPTFVNQSRHGARKDEFKEMGLGVQLKNDKNDRRPHALTLSEEETDVAMALQAGFSSILRREQGYWQESDGSLTTVTTKDSIYSSEGDASSMTSMRSEVGAVESEMSEEEVEYEVKRAQTQSVEVKRGVLVSWGAEIVPSMSTVSVDLSEFPLPPK